MANPILDIQFLPSTSYSTSGDAQAFGLGTGSYTISNPSGISSWGLRISVSGNASLINKIEYDITPSIGIAACGYYDSNNTYVGPIGSFTNSTTTHHIIENITRLPSSIGRIYTNTSSGTATSKTFSNLRVYDVDGNILNMETVDPPTDPPTEPPASDYTLLIGSTDISSIYLGEDEATSIYLGEDLIYSGGSTPTLELEPT